ncbi:TIGR04222 domain-containing protein [Streptomyces sp. TLI_053]|uniref:TIGR04222 domain-containing membrane protein n=1 Tax=Streptomyces sp. TLI_053 TaxID=1855352 RepID=UPI00087A5925|nr:TIGR04222 domain-containing membrane protein [Streptomyces sp. TLI_053]SDT50297.1 TIGR04222 domain-containing protein [Streptomyces sp. TLI_053]
MWHNSYYVVPGLLLAATVLVAQQAKRAARRVSDPKGLPGRGIALLEAAFLAGGPGRVFDTALVRMHRRGHVVVSRSRLVTLTAAEPVDEVDGAIVDAIGASRSRDLDSLRVAVMRAPAVQAVGDALAARGLLRNPERLRRARTAHRTIWLALAVTAAFAVAAPLLASDEPGSDGPALWPPLLLLVLGLVSLLVTRPPKGRVTPAGRRQLGLMDTGKPWQPHHGAFVSGADAVLLGAVALGGLALLGPDGLGDAELHEAMLAAAGADQSARAVAAGTGSSSGSSCATGPAVWCGSSSDSSDSSGSSGSSGSGCGSSFGCSGSSCSSGSSGSSCSSGSSGCGSSSGSSCGGGGCGS